MSNIISGTLFEAFVKGDSKYKQLILNFALFVNRFQKEKKCIFPKPLMRRIITEFMPDDFVKTKLFQVIDVENLNSVLVFLNTNFKTQKKVVIEILKKAGGNDISMEEVLKYMFKQYLGSDCEFEKIDELEDKHYEQLIVSLMRAHRELPSDLMSVFENCITRDFISFYNEFDLDNELNKENESNKENIIKTTQIEYSENIKLIPKTILNCKNLTSLLLSNCELIGVFPEIGEMKNLEKLDLSCNKLRSIPTEISHCTHLKELNLNSNKFHLFPREIFSCLNLTCLVLSNNEFTDLPIEIENLTKLERLFLDFNHLKSLPSEIGQLKNLKMLNVTYNQLDLLPIQIGDLTSLEELLLGKNNLKLLPAKIGNLSQLEALQLSSNEIEFLPLEIGNLSKLKHLYLDNNQLKSLPDEFKKLLSSLVLLNLVKNKFQIYPDWLRREGQMKYLFY